MNFTAKNENVCINACQTMPGIVSQPMTPRNTTTAHPVTSQSLVYKQV